MWYSFDRNTWLTKGVQAQKNTGKCPEAGGRNMAGGLSGAAVLNYGRWLLQKVRKKGGFFEEVPFAFQFPRGALRFYGLNPRSHVVTEDMSQS